MTTAPLVSIGTYIAGFSPEIQLLPEQVQATIRQVAPAAQEIISYAMLPFKLHGNQVMLRCPSSIQVFTRCCRPSKHLGRSWPPAKAPRAQYASPSNNPCHWI